MCYLKERNMNKRVITKLLLDENIVWKLIAMKQQIEKNEIEKLHFLLLEQVSMDNKW